MKDLNKLIEKINPVLKMNVESIKKEDFHQKIYSMPEIKEFLNENSKNEDDYVNIYNLIKKIPYIIFLIDIDNKKDFNYFFEAYLNPDKDFLSLYNYNSLMGTYLSFGFILEWFVEHKEYLGKEEFLMINAPLSQHMKYLLENITDLFYENYENKTDFLMDLHSVCAYDYCGKTNISIPFKLIEKYIKDIDVKLFNLLKENLFRNKIRYVSPNSSDSVHSHFKKFVTNDAIVDFINSEEYLDIECFKTLLVNYNEIMDEEFFEKLTKNFMGYKKSLEAFKFLPTETQNKMASIALNLNTWVYIHLNLHTRKKLINIVDFKENRGLLSVHPEKDKVPNEIWVDALKESQIKLSTAPSFIFEGERSFTEDEWFEILAHVPKVKNNNFLSLVNSYKYILTNSLLDRLSALSGHEILNREFMKNYINNKKNIKEKKDTLDDIIKVAKTKDEKLLSSKITKMFSIGLGSKENIEKVLKAFKD